MIYAAPFEKTLKKQLKKYLNSHFKLIHQILTLLVPFGRRELVFVLALVFLQGVVQAVGIFSIMPFLALATNPEGILASSFGQRLMQIFPSIGVDNVVVLAGAITMTLLVLTNVVNGLTDYYRARYAYFSGMRIGSYLLHAYAHQPYVFHLKNNSAELVKRLQSEVNTFTAGILIPFLDIISRGVNVLLILAMLLLVNPVVCIVVFFVFGTLLCLSSVGFRRPVIRGNIERKSLISQRFLSANQLLTGVKTAIIHRCQGYFVSRFEKAYQQIAAHDSFVVIASNGPRYVIESLAFSSMVILVLVLHLRDQSLQSVLPALVFFVVASYRMLPALQTIYGQIIKIQSQRFAVDILYDDYTLLRPVTVAAVMASPAVGGQADRLAFEHEIVFDRVSYRYPESTKLSLRDVSFTIKKGSKIGIVGSSGAGKSTLVDLLIGLLPPYAGNIKVDGTGLDDASVSAWQSLVGYVSQDIFLLDDTLRSNIAFGVATENIVEAQVIAAAKVAQIHDYIVQDMPEAYDTVCGERGVRLSGGQRQRIALARALYHQPNVLIFDEATSALDNETERNLVTAIDALPDYFTIVTVAHRLSTVRNCDRILVFDKGCLVGSDTYDELIRSSSAFKQLATYGQRN